MNDLVQQVSDIVVVLVALGSAYAVYRKIRPEVDKLSAESSLLHVTAQAKVIDDLQTEIDRQQRQIDRMKRDHAAEKKAMRQELDTLTKLNLELQTRMIALEQQLKTKA